MLELFRNMIKEEWRVHTNLFGSILFLLFPIIIIVIVSMASMFGPFLKMMFPMSAVILAIHYVYLFFGFNIGAFGLYGKEFMNRRFGHASLLAYSSRTLPISERTIFLNVVVKDILYYFLLFILPCTIGIAIWNPGFRFLPLLSSGTLSFLLGLSIVFFLSTLYAHSAKLLVGFLVILGAIWAFAGFSRFIPYTYYLTGSMKELMITIFVILSLCTASALFFKIDFPMKTRIFKNRLIFFSLLFKRSKDRVFLSKDMLDLLRSRGGPGRIIFSLVLPMALIWAFLHYFVMFLPIVNFLILFSIFLGLFSSSIYNWLSEFDSFTQYSFLPIDAAGVIRSKLKVTMIVGLVSVLLFAAACTRERDWMIFLPAFLSFVSLFVYGLAITVFLTGLYPNILFYNGKNFLSYILLIMPPPVLLIFLSALNPLLLLLSPVLILISMYIIKKGYKRWNGFEQLTF